MSMELVRERCLTCSTIYDMLQRSANIPFKSRYSATQLSQRGTRAQHYWRQGGAPSELQVSV